MFLIFMWRITLKARAAKPERSGGFDVLCLYLLAAALDEYHGF
jgi:hypothetical protein